LRKKSRAIEKISSWNKNTRCNSRKQKILDRRYGTFVVHLRKCIISEIAQITQRKKKNEIEDSIRTLNGTRI